ncbi:copper-binding protein [Mitsuaria sp. WAJ17]|uniref:copper-binding protein n=1 Tax=Mitsuaria sp. WAJ17 TaxID=2761452 RepID=UPI0016016585|nr:copper-binding protein [Mitsuaria sp. WAJ17]MBB2484182.1 copper-binding protein [Mitsuaria sp. WAJ17]
MNTLKHIALAALVAIGWQAAPSALAQGSTASAPAADLTEGEIRKVDKEARKLTIKHGEIRNLDMAPMTMMFQVKDLAMLDQVKAGDRVRFKAERKGASLVVTELQPQPR